MHPSVFLSVCVVLFALFCLGWVRFALFVFLLFRLRLVCLFMFVSVVFWLFGCLAWLFSVVG